MLRRIEIAWPITDIQLQARIMQECVAPYLNDTEDAWLLERSGEYQHQSLSNAKTNKLSAQKMLIKRYSSDE
jgi:polyphosphate kinase